MTASIAVTCCGRVLALIADDDPGLFGREGELTISSASDAPGSTGIVIASPIEIDGVAPYEMTPGQVMRTWFDPPAPNLVVSQTFWLSGAVTWALRCRSCPTQAELSDGTLRKVADALRAAGCDEVPLGVLCRMLSRPIG